MAYFLALSGTAPFALGLFGVFALLERRARRRHLGERYRDWATQRSVPNWALLWAAAFGLLFVAANWSVYYDQVRPQIQIADKVTRFAEDGTTATELAIKVRNPCFPCVLRIDVQGGALMDAMVRQPNERVRSWHAMSPPPHVLIENPEGDFILDLRTVGAREVLIDWRFDRK